EMTTLPEDFRLYQNFPQAFYKVTRLGFDIPENTRVKLVIYDIFGRDVIQLVDSELNPGSYEVKWHAHKLPAGIYYYKLRAGDFVDSKKMVLLNN
ncbi:MAG TPA: T9SS type A sorting domain-containing protein, partial [Ignavibacteria bacterium]